MNKIERDKYNVNLFIPEDNSPKDVQEYILVKRSDDVFNGFHPNGIGRGYTTIGTFDKAPTVGERFIIRGERLTQYLNTSPVTEIVSDTVFKTQNSTYELTPYYGNLEI